MNAPATLAHFHYLLRRGDDALILGQRLSEWCGHSPLLEEDIALANTALDLIGRARLLLTHAGNIEDLGRDEDTLAYRRDEREFQNLLIYELPIGDFGFTMMRQFLTDAYAVHLFQALQTSSDETLAAIASKASKECAYHLRRSADWVCRLGDGTADSRHRMQTALDRLWPYTDELFNNDELDAEAQVIGVAPAVDPIADQWHATVAATLRDATLRRPETTWQARGGRAGLHTEHLGRLLAEMQFLQRAYPGLSW